MVIQIALTIVIVCVVVVYERKSPLSMPYNTVSEYRH